MRRAKCAATAAILAAGLMSAPFHAAGVAAAEGGQPTATVLKPGDAAPSFSLPGSDGRTYTLDQFKGKQAVVIAWFPKAFTGG
jgi:peroxiredoxin Q/BCP